MREGAKGKQGGKETREREIGGGRESKIENIIIIILFHFLEIEQNKTIYYLKIYIIKTKVQISILLKQKYKYRFTLKLINYLYISVTKVINSLI